MNFIQKGLLYTALVGAGVVGGYYARARTTEKIELKNCGVAISEPVYGFPVVKDAENNRYVANFPELKLEKVTNELVKQKRKIRLEELFK